MADVTKPVAIEMHKPASSKELYPIEGPSELLTLWREASEKYERSFPREGCPKEDVDLLSQPNIETWLLDFKESRHRDTKFRNICKVVSRHLHIIQTATSFIKLGSSIASSFFVAASAASIIVNGFAFLFGSVVKVSEDFDKIESFFGKMAKTFGHLQSLDGRLDLPGMQHLKKYIVEIFISSLDICRIGFSQTENRFRKWLQQMKGDDVLDDAFKKMQDAENEFIKAIKMSMLVLGATTVDLATDIKTGLEETKFQEMLDWLSSKSSRYPHNDREELCRQLEQAEYNTEAGKWLLESEDFKNWRDRDCKKLWYTGAPGAGKSVIASIIIKNLSSLIHQPSEPSKKPAVGYVFLSYKRKPDVAIILGSIARQILMTCGGERELAKRFHKCPDKEHKLGKEELLELLSSLIKDRHLYIVVDAMDECPRKLRESLLETLQKIKSQNAVVKILVTSRNMENLAEYQKTFTCCEIKANNEDIDEYIRHIIEQHGKHLKRYSNVIHETVSKKSSGMFIIVRLHMDALADVQLEGDILTTLYELPETLNEAYDNTFDRIQGKPAQSKEIAISVIAWVSHAIDPLSTKELCHALAAMKINQNGILEKFLLEENQIITYCCGLIVVDIDRDVRFVHRSAQDYFNQRKTVRFPNFEYQMALTCAKYLIYCATKRPSDLHLQTKFEKQSRRRKNIKRSIIAKLREFHFAAYAGKYLHIHTHRVRHLPEASDFPEAKLSTLIDQLVNDSSSRQFYSYLLCGFEAYYTMSDILDDQNDSKSLDITVELDVLHLAAFLGNKKSVEEAIKSHKIDSLDSYGQSALVVAFKNNLDDIAETLLDHGATVDLRKRRGHALLLYAAEKNYLKTVEKIIGSVPENRPRGFLKILGLVMILFYYLLKLLAESVMSRAAESKESAKPETKDGIDPMNEESLSDYRLLLSFAYNEQWEDIDDLLTMGRIDLSLMEIENSSPYKSASHSSYELSTSYRQKKYRLDIAMQSTVDDDSSDDEVNEEDSTKGSSDGNNDDEVYEKDSNLQDGKSDYGNSVDGNKSKDASRQTPRFETLFINTAYFLTMELGHCRAMEILLKRAIDFKPDNINIRNYRGQSLLHRATATNNKGMVIAVLEGKPEIDLRDYNDRTALMAYADPDRKIILNILHDHGADLDLRHKDRNHELYEAAVFGAIKVVQFYLNNKVDASIVNVFGWTPLHGAAANGHLEVVEALLIANANPSPISDTGRTPLDLVKSGDTHYDRTLTDCSRRHYSYVEQKLERMDQVDIDQLRDDIEDLLRRHGAKTSRELSNKLGRDCFNYGIGGMYTHKGYHKDDYASEIRRHDDNYISCNCDEGMTDRSRDLSGSKYLIRTPSDFF